MFVVLMCKYYTVSCSRFTQFPIIIQSVGACWESADTTHYYPRSLKRQAEGSLIKFDDK